MPPHHSDSTIKHLIFGASKFCDFKRLIYWYSLILAVSQFHAFYSYFLLSLCAYLFGNATHFTFAQGAYGGNHHVSIFPNEGLISSS